jgi:hypothetical protein
MCLSYEHSAMFSVAFGFAVGFTILWSFHHSRLCNIKQEKVLCFCIFTVNVANQPSEKLKITI